MERRIKQKITELEQQYHIHILYACESGSRVVGRGDFPRQIVIMMCVLFTFIRWISI